MYGQTINEDGIILAETSGKQNGQIELRATSSGMIETGPNSLISSPVVNTYTNGLVDTNVASYPFNGGVVNMGSLETIDSDGLVVQLGLPQYISLSGSIYANSGYVNINAGTRVFINSGSTIDVSGVWSNESESNVALTVQLNSQQLQNAYALQNGILYQQNITVNPMTWPVSNLSGSLLAQQLNLTTNITGQVQTAFEKAVNGGSIWITSGYSNQTASSSAWGDIIVEQGAQLNISGGGIHYSAGAINTTQLVALGGKIYDISDAPANLSNASILGIYTKHLMGVSFNTTESWNGLYYGAGSALNVDLPNFDKGGNAGSLNLSAVNIVLEGQIISNVTRGKYQTVNTNPSQFPYNYTADLYDAVNLSYMQGTEMPSGGEVIINTNYPGTNVGPIAQGLTASTSISIVPASSYQSPLPPGFNCQSTLPGSVQSGSSTFNTIIPASVLTGADLSNLTFASSNNFNLAPGVKINLSSGGYIINRYSNNQNSPYSTQSTAGLTSLSTVYLADGTAVGTTYNLSGSSYYAVEALISDAASLVIKNSDGTYDYSNAISPAPRGQFNVYAGASTTNPGGSITIGGQVILPSGTINIKAGSNIYLMAGSDLDVSGRIIDNALVGKVAGVSPQAAVFYQGGNIVLDADYTSDSVSLSAAAPY